MTSCSNLKHSFDCSQLYNFLPLLKHFSYDDDDDDDDDDGGGGGDDDDDDDDVKKFKS